MHRIGNSMAWNCKQHGVKLETVGHELPYVENSTVILTMFSENAKFVFKSHCAFTKCRVCLKSSMYFSKMQSLVELYILRPCQHKNIFLRCDSDISGSTHQKYILTAFHSQNIFCRCDTDIKIGRASCRERV